jgi:hypothetical protein
VCWLLVLNSVTSTPQWIRKPEPRDMHGRQMQSESDDSAAVRTRSVRHEGILEQIHLDTRLHELWQRLRRKK